MNEAETRTEHIDPALHLWKTTIHPLQLHVLLPLEGGPVFVSQVVQFLMSPDKRSNAHYSLHYTAIKKPPTGPTIRRRGWFCI